MSLGIPVPNRVPAHLLEMIFLLAIALGIGAVGADYSFIDRDVGNWQVTYRGELKTYTEAKAECSSLGASLVGEDALDEILTWTDGDNRPREYWIGLTDIKQEGVWKWDVGSGANLQNNWGRWNNGKPYNENRNCAFVYGKSHIWKYGSKVRDGNCNDERRPVLCVKTQPCPVSQGWTTKLDHCEFDGSATSLPFNSISKIYIAKYKKPGEEETYSYAGAKSKCSAWGATLVREQDMLDAVITWSQDWASKDSRKQKYLGNYWIGLHSTTTTSINGKWKWDYGSRHILQSNGDLTQWKSGQPTHNCCINHGALQCPCINNRCASVTDNGEVSEALCDNTRPLLCVKKQHQEIVACEGDVLEINCNEKKLHIKDVLYGRINPTTCSHPDQKKNNRDDCRSGDDSLNRVKNICGGLRRNGGYWWWMLKSCRFTVNNWFGDPCGGIYKYMKVSYECV